MKFVWIKIPVNDKGWGFVHRRDGDILGLSPADIETLNATPASELQPSPDTVERCRNEWVDWVRRGGKKNDPIEVIYLMARVAKSMRDEAATTIASLQAEVEMLRWFGDLSEGNRE
jgi:hypothetical protein